MTTINLRDGLEALYYFGEQDFDPQRNQLQDHSGYGRHATANGGPTVGVNGPNDFSATSFDGNDDYFNAGIRPLQEQTIFFIAKARDKGDNVAPSILFSNKNSNVGFRLTFQYRDGSGQFQIQFYDGSGSDRELVTAIDKNRWYAGFVYWNGSQLAIGLDGETKDVEPVSSHNESTNYLNIGRTPNRNNWYFAGDCSLIVRWSRGLSITELRELTRLTAPLRSQL